MPKPIHRGIRNASWLFVAVSLVLLSIVSISVTQTRPQAKKPPSTVPADWTAVEKLIAEQKYQEAAQAAEKIRMTEQKTGNQNEWTRAFIKEVQLKIGLHGYESAVRLMKETPWPTGVLNRATVNLFYARTLSFYYRGYSWEINQREKVESAQAADLKAWTKEQIYAEAQKAYADVWSQRATLGREPGSRLSEFLDRNNYPEGIRNTLRDAISYLFVDLLADTSFWSPQESNETYRLDLKALLSPDQKEIPLLNPSVHPIQKIAYVLSDLEHWHTQNSRREAALEARLERIERLSRSFTGSGDHALLLSGLETVLSGCRDLPWWAKGKAMQADMLRSQDRPDKLVRAHTAAEAGWKAYPDSIGGKRCLSTLKSIEAPEYAMAAMSADGVNKRSIEVTHRNLPALYLRAFPYDLAARLGSARDYNLLPSGKELESVLQGRPAAEWTIELPATPDYDNHRTFVTPPMKERAAYVIAASARKDFARVEGNRISTTVMIVSDVVLLVQQSEPFSVRAVSGETGAPLPNVAVDLYQYDWQRGHRRVMTQRTDAEGLIVFPQTARQDNARYFLFARQGANVALDASYLYYYRTPEPVERRDTLIYTDRSIYRPTQKLFWKAVAYSGISEKARFTTIPSTSLTISLLDPNGETVESRTVSTNGYGTAAGEFNLPTGRLLGNWQLRSSWNGAASVRVEEYKRPTFEVAIKDPESALRLNKPAVLSGDVKYYFGLPVTNGSVRWRVTREPVYPWWWGWYGRVSSSSAQTIAAGAAALGEDGTFRLSFTPEADERAAAESKEISYRYRLTADVTDEGGETRSAARAFRLGFVAIEASITGDTGFIVEGTTSSFHAQRTDLDGIGRAGRASWRLTTLRQPATAPLPADLPVGTDGQQDPAQLRTAGDRLRPRWNSRYTYESILRSWPDGEERGRGTLNHDQKGMAEIAVPVLPGGAYRIDYETSDEFGATFRTTREFLVAGPKTVLALPALLIPETQAKSVGATARFLALSGIPGQPLFYEIRRGGNVAEQRTLMAGRDSSLIEIPLNEADRGGISVRLSAVQDFQLMTFSFGVFVPFDNKQLKVEFATFRDRMRPGAKETWRVTVKTPSGAGAEQGAAELLAYMYDKSLDLFAPHNPPNPMALYSRTNDLGSLHSTLGQAQTQLLYNEWVHVPAYPSLEPDRLKFYDDYGIGGPGRRRARGGMVGGVAGGVAYELAAPPMAAPPAPVAESMMMADAVAKKSEAPPAQAAATPATEKTPELRGNFAETAFWSPQLLTGSDGSAVIEFTVPDSVTSWNVWVHAITRDLLSGSAHKEARSVKDLMVRPYIPRFLREGDKAEIKVVVNNAADRELKGNLKFEILDPDTDQVLLRDFGVSEGTRPFVVAAGKGTNLNFPITVPAKVGLIAFRVTASSEDLSDGELRPLPLLPGRMHLAQSRFVTLKNKDRREMTFADLKSSGDPTRVNEQMVVTLDAQLFYSVLSALPYLVNFPYECTEQTLNRFVSTGMLSSLYQKYPAVEKMAQEFSKRNTPLETWDAADPNRKMALEETPWLTEAKGGKDAGFGMVNVLDPRITRAEREAALSKLRKSQTANGAFPWWPGGPPSPYMTLYIMYGFAKAAEFGVEVPKDVVQRGWAYLAQHFREEYASKMIKNDCCWEFLTFLNYVASCYPDPSWMGNALTAKERQDILNHCFRHWQQHSPYLKFQLALTLRWMSRPKDASLVLASVMDSAKTTEDQGTFWAPEDRAWLWYNDTVETQAFALRSLMEIEPKDPRSEGLVQWLFLNKKLNHWKSTRATAEVIYSLVHYLQAEGQVATREDATVRVGGQTVQFVFEPDQYTGKKNQTVIAGSAVGTSTATVVVEKGSPGFLFASATWQFSTEKLPEQGSGDFLSVTRTYFRRENSGKGFTLKPIAEGAALQAGDEVEVQLSIRAKHPCEYVHLRDPRAAGLEPENAVSRYRWDLGISWYEEVRDSGTNFFFEWLPQGEYNFKYRLRANMAGVFRVSPATLQSMYAPEFNAYSSGAVLTISGNGKAQ
jgi:alpha-2-macroglobulin